MTFFERTVSARLEDAASENRLVRLTGPAGAGKTMILQKFCENDWNYIDLRDPEVEARVNHDPDFFLSSLAFPAVLDGMERTPELAGAMLRTLKNSSSEKQRYITAGTIDSLETGGEKIPGQFKAATLKLYPLSFREIAGLPEAVLPWEEGEHMRNSFLHGEFLWENILTGGMPKLHANREIDRHQWFCQYAEETIPEDIKTRRKKITSEPILPFMKLLAAKTGEPLNLSEMARELDSTHHIVSTWLDLLVSFNQVILISPYSDGVKSPVVKTDKAYFTNSGLLCYLLGISDTLQAMRSGHSKKIFETAVLNEVLRALRHRGKNNNIFFWRKATGMEVSIIVKDKEGIQIIETSPSTGVDMAEVKGLRFMKKEMGELIRGAYIANPGKTTVPATQGIRSLPLSRL